MEPSSFSVVSSARTRDNETKRQIRKQEVPSDDQEPLLCCAGTEVLAQDAQRCCGILQEIFRSCLDIGLGSLLWVALLDWGRSRWTQRSLPTSPSCDSVKTVHFTLCLLLQWWHSSCVKLYSYIFSEAIGEITVWLTWEQIISPICQLPFLILSCTCRHYSTRQNLC